VRQEVLGQAAIQGRPTAILELDPEAVQPSVELLEQVLSLKGGLPEAQLARLRALVARVVEALVQALAVRVRPALTGLTLARPTRRPTGRLDLRATIGRNLRTARPDPAGGPARLIPEIPIFRTRGRRAMDWRVVLVVDTSGSMDANTIHAALMAAILTGLPAVTVHFVAFSTEVVDLTERAHDPLGLLLEVKVGGGTNIAKALRYARTLVTAPTRTLLILLSDFEEGGAPGPMLAQIRDAVGAGVRALGLAALDEQARPNYNVAIAEQCVAAGMPVAALTPLALARWVAEQIR
jgi:Mg-chelatase subunit ChlD